MKSLAHQVLLCKEGLPETENYFLSHGLFDKLSKLLLHDNCLPAYIVCVCRSEPKAPAKYVSILVRAMPPPDSENWTPMPDER